MVFNCIEFGTIKILIIELPTVTHVIDSINLTPWYPEPDSFQNEEWYVCQNH